MPVLETTTNLLGELQAVRAETDRLFSILTPEALYARPISERHRVVFYIGHLDGFDSIQICSEALGLASPDPQLDELFRAGIDPDSSSLPSDTSADWPPLDQVKAYVTRSRKRVDDHFANAPDDAIHMAVEHRHMHAETLAYMFHNFGYDMKHVAQAARLEQTSRENPVNGWIEIPAGDAVLGKRHDGKFGWDNEYEEVRRPVPTFRIQQKKVTNGDYLRFVKAGAAMPHFWTKHNDTLFYRGMFEEIALPLNWPVYVTQTEAESYARWLGKAIPTEEQFHRAAYATPGNQERTYPWGDAEPSPLHGNFDFRRWDPEAVDASPLGRSAYGVNQLVGNGWEWTSTKFGPFPGFKPSATYPGYSSNFFDSEHFVIKGGSPRTSGRLLRKSFRNWFRRDYPYVYATFRCVEN